MCNIKGMLSVVICKFVNYSFSVFEYEYMNVKKLGLAAFVLLNASLLKAQSEYLPIHGKVANFIERYKILNPNDTILKYQVIQPFKASEVIPRLAIIENLNKSNQIATPLSRSDADELSSILDGYAEYAPQHKTEEPKGVFVSNSHLYESHSEKGDFHIDPLLDYQWGKANGGRSIYQKSFGLSFHGNLHKKFVYYGEYTYNRERDPQYVVDYTTAHSSLPGIYKYSIHGKEGKEYYRYNNFRGGIAYQAGNHFDFQLAYDKLFIGDGIRSLFISDFSSPYFYFKASATAGKVRYTTGVAKTTGPWGVIDNGLGISGKPTNYVFYQYVTWQTTRWLRLGFHENNNFNSHINGGFQIGMLNPFIFNRSMSSNVGNSGKSSIGLDFNANIRKRVSVYGQLLINEFVSDHFFSLGKSSWRNKRALQLGIKYDNAFSLQNFNLQAEVNTARPFTYTDKWVVNNFTNNNLPLAHPLGANFSELLGRASYHPISKLFLDVTFMYYAKGLDMTSNGTSTGANYGGDLLRPYLDHLAAQELSTGDGIKAKNYFITTNASYEFAPNFYLDGSFTYRKYKVETIPDTKDQFFSFGFRWNMSKRNFLF